MQSQLAKHKVVIIGTVGVPGNYGGFETLAENLVLYHHDKELPCELSVYCSRKNYSQWPRNYLSARLKYLPLQANGVQSIPYDILSLLYSLFNRSDVILILGVSGAILLPFIRMITTCKIVTNIDGIEWRRQKWNGIARWFLRYSERLAVRYSHKVIADNDAIADYIHERYGRDCFTIAYGGDHAFSVQKKPVVDLHLPNKYALSVCRIEPENNVQLIVEAFSKSSTIPLVMVGNWDNSQYGRAIRKQYAGFNNLFLMDPIYDLGKLKTLRSSASLYVHGHSAGGTNPSLVEAMHFGKPIAAYDCVYNRATTENQALYFSDVDSLVVLLSKLGTSEDNETVGGKMKEIASRRYTWAFIAKEYFRLMGCSDAQKAN